LLAYISRNIITLFVAINHLVASSENFMAKYTSKKDKGKALVKSLEECLKSCKDFGVPDIIIEQLTVILALAVNIAEILPHKNSKTSSQNPSGDQGREHKSKAGKSNKKPGGQKGRKGVTAEPVDIPDFVETIEPDAEKMANGTWRLQGYEKVQVIEVKITKIVIEYHLATYVNEKGEKVKAELPKVARYGCVGNENPSDLPSNQDGCSKFSMDENENPTDKEQNLEPRAENLSIEKDGDVSKSETTHNKNFNQDDVNQVSAASEIKRISETEASNKELDKLNKVSEENRPKVVYGITVKALLVYMSVFQLIPFKRLADFVLNVFGFNISVGTIYNFKMEAYRKLEQFELWAKTKLIESRMIHGDETGIRIAGKRRWLHVIANSLVILLMPHQSRGSEAMKDMGVLPYFKGVIIHDCWYAYFTFQNCLHSLCNAHHVRELKNLAENLDINWALLMMKYLYTINNIVHESGGQLNELQQQLFVEGYRDILERARLESPESPKIPGKRGKQKQSTARNLLNRLIKYENEILRFMTASYVPFTNNFAEFCVRMAKVQVKISGCFRSWAGSRIYCRIRSYILTCQRHGIEPLAALTMLFTGELPSFINLSEIVDPNSKESQSKTSSEKECGKDRLAS
jgi:hypothetical protein